MCVKANNIQPVKLDNEEIDMINSFTYLGAVIDTTDNATIESFADIKIHRNLTKLNKKRQNLLVKNVI